LENEEFKAKLPALLQSKHHPSVFHSWGGGAMLEQIQAGFCQDITNAIAGDFKDSSIHTMGVQVTEAAILNQRCEMRKTATAAKKQDRPALQLRALIYDD
jgi:hypothetical protein